MDAAEIKHSVETIKQVKGSGTEEHMIKKLGFTLIEMMIAVALIGILTAIAIPFYQQYVNGSRIAAAKTDLVGLGAALSSYYQQNLVWPSTSQTSAAGIATMVTGWAPSLSSTYFTYQYNYTSSTNITVTAQPVNGPFANCTWTLNVINNTRSVSASNSATCPAWS